MSDGLLEERDRSVCAMWNDGAKTSAIARKHGITEYSVYAIVRRRRDRGWDVGRRQARECVCKRNRTRWDAIKQRALALEVLANDGKVDPTRALSAKRAAHVMGVSITTIYRNAKLGKLAHERDGHVMRFRLGDLIDWARCL